MPLSFWFLYACLRFHCRFGCKEIDGERASSSKSWLVALSDKSRTRTSHVRFMRLSGLSGNASDRITLRGATRSQHGLLQKSSGRSTRSDFFYRHNIFSRVFDLGGVDAGLSPKRDCFHEALLQIADFVDRGPDGVWCFVGMGISPSCCEGSHCTIRAFIRTYAIASVSFVPWEFLGTSGIYLFSRAFCPNRADNSVTSHPELAVRLNPSSGR